MKRLKLLAVLSTVSFMLGSPVSFAYADMTGVTLASITNNTFRAGGIQPNPNQGTGTVSSSGGGGGIGAILQTTNSDTCGGTSFPDTSYQHTQSDNTIAVGTGTGAVATQSQIVFMKYHPRLYLAIKNHGRHANGIIYYSPASGTGAGCNFTLDPSIAPKLTTSYKVYVLKATNAKGQVVPINAKKTSQTTNPNMSDWFCPNGSNVIVGGGSPHVGSITDFGQGAISAKNPPITSYKSAQSTGLQIFATTGNKFYNAFSKNNGTGAPVWGEGFSVKNPNITATCSGEYEVETIIKANNVTQLTEFQDHVVPPTAIGYTPPSNTPPPQPVLPPPNNNPTPDVWVSQ